MLCLEQQRLAAAWAEVAGGAPAAAPAAAAAEVAAGMPRQGGSSPSSAARHMVGSAAPVGPSGARCAGRPSGLPAVRVERGGSSAGSAHTTGAPAAALHAGWQLQGQHNAAASCAQPPSWSAAASADMPADGSAALEDAIADVELCDAEEVVVWSEEQDSSQPAALDHGTAAAAPGELDGTGPAAAGLDGAGDGAMEAQQLWLPGGSTADRSPPAVAAAAPADAMSKASSALARFNQLRSSLAQHDSLQGRLASSIASLQHSPPSVPTAVATPQPVDGAAVAPPATAPGSGLLSGAAQQDEMRRLGRSLLAAAAPSSALSAAPVGGPPAQSLAPPHVHAQDAAQQAGPSAAPVAAAAPPCGSSGDAVVSEVQHPDGRWERLFASGAREQRFANGSAKHTLPSGASLTRFANGDVKKVLPGGTVEYFFAEVASWQVTHPSGVDVFFFPSGQVRCLPRVAGEVGWAAVDCMQLCGCQQCIETTVAWCACQCTPPAAGKCAWLAGCTDVTEQRGAGRAPLLQQCNLHRMSCLRCLQVEAHHPGGVKEVSRLPFECSWCAAVCRGEQR